MNDFYLTDNLKKFKNFINKNHYIIKECYDNAISNNSFKILNYIIIELDYIEDYFIIKNKLPYEYKKSIFKVFKKKDNYYDIVYKYLFKIIKNNNFDEFSDLYDNDQLYLLSNHIEYLFVLKRKDLILFCLDNDLYTNRIFKFAIYYDYLSLNIFNKYFDNLIYDFCIYEESINKYISIIDYIIFKNRIKVFNNLIDQKCIHLNMIDNINFYSQENLIDIINNSIPSEDFNDLINFYKSILKNQENFDIILLSKLLFEKYKNFCFLSFDEANDMMDNKYHLNFFSTICIYCESFEIYDFYIDYYTKVRKEVIDKINDNSDKIPTTIKTDKQIKKENKQGKNKSEYKNKKVELILEKYIDNTYILDIYKYLPFIFRYRNIKFIKEFIQKYNIQNIDNKLQSNIRIYKNYEYKLEYILDFSNENIYTKKIIIDALIDKIDYFINKFEFNFNNFTINHSLYSLLIIITNFVNGDYYDEDEDEYEIIDFDKKNKEYKELIEKIIIFINKNKNKIDFKNNMNNIFSLKYLNEILDLISNFIDFNEIDNKNFKNFYNEDNYFYIKNKINNDKFIEILNTIDDFYYFHISKNIFEDIINNTEFDLKNITNNNFKRSCNYEYDNIFFKKLDLIIDNISEPLFLYYDLYNIISNTSLEPEYIKKYFKYISKDQLDNLFLISCKKSNITFIKYFMNNGNKMSYKLIKKYDLDPKKLFIGNDIIGKLSCIICMTNSPSVICIPCGHIVMCNYCFDHIQDKCPYDNTELKNYYYLKGNSEEERIICKLCKNNILEYIYNECGHTVCKNCCFNKCNICKKKSKSTKIYFV